MFLKVSILSGGKKKEKSVERKTVLRKGKIRNVNELWKELMKVAC